VSSQHVGEWKGNTRGKKGPSMVSTRLRGPLDNGRFGWDTLACKQNNGEEMDGWMDGWMDGKEGDIFFCCGAIFLWALFFKLHALLCCFLFAFYLADNIFLFFIVGVYCCAC
jgi:hypothetical protein